jgi:Holliday junction resolvase
VSRRERAKGLAGEREVAELLRAGGFTVRGLEGAGDWLAFADSLTLHVETKRQENARPWLWIAQAEAEAPAGTLPIVAFRRSRMPWWGMAPLGPLVTALTRHESGPGYAAELLADAPAVYMPGQPT